MNGSLTFFMFSLSLSLSLHNDTGVVEAVGLVEYNSQTLQGLRTEVQFYTSPPPHPSTTRLEQMFSVYLYTQLELVNYWCDYLKKKREGGGGAVSYIFSWCIFELKQSVPCALIWLILLLKPSVYIEQQYFICVLFRIFGIHIRIPHHAYPFSKQENIFTLRQFCIFCNC